MQYDKGRKPRFGLTSLAGLLIAYVGIGLISILVSVGIIVGAVWLVVKMLQGMGVL